MRKARLCALAALAVVCLALPMLVLGCEPVDGCRPTETRCDYSVAQVCAADQRWLDIMNCRELDSVVGGGWTCIALDGGGGHACVPVENPDGGVR
jgi:hypothetical protein